MELTIRKLGREDTSLIFELERNHTPGKPIYVLITQDDLDFIFDHPQSSQAFGFFDREELIAWGAYAGHEGKRFEISPVFIHTDYRGKKLGEKLFKMLCEEIQKHSPQEIFLTVSPKNTPALMLYTKNGFEIYDFQKDVYGPNTDRLFMRK